MDSQQLDVEAIAYATRHSDDDWGRQLALRQTKHRLEILTRFNVAPGSKVLEVGCGQGDFTVVLAAAVGETGHVTAIDPASLDYGRPFTLGQAQDHISEGPLGGRITWVQNDPISFLSSRPADEPLFDLIVFANSLWYFSSPTQIGETLSLAGKHAKRLAIAEYSLHASPAVHLHAIPHVYAAFAQAALEVRKTDSTSNIRTVIGPKGIISLTEAGGLRVVQETAFTPAADVDDARWETGLVGSADFLEQIETTLKENDRERQLALALRDAMIAAIADIPEGRKGIRMMDVWCATFEKQQ